MTVTPPRERARRRTLRTRAVAALGADRDRAASAARPGRRASPRSPDAHPRTRRSRPARRPSRSPRWAAGSSVPGDRLSVSVTLQNGTDAATRPGHRHARPRRDAAARPRGAHRLARRATPSGVRDRGGRRRRHRRGARPAPAQVAGIGVEADNPALQSLAPGVYPLVATYPGPDGPVTLDERDDRARRPRRRRSESASSSRSPRPGCPTGLLTADELVELTAPTGSLTNQLNARRGHLGDPRRRPRDPGGDPRARHVGARIRARCGSTGSRRCRSRGSRCSSATPMSRCSSRPGSRGPLGPTSLSAYMNPRDFVPDAEPTPQADARRRPRRPRSIPTRRSIPTSPTLLDIGGGRAGVFWPAAGTAGPATVATLGGLTVDDQTSLTLVPVGVDGRRARPAPPSPAHAHAGEADVLVYDTDVSRALDEASAHRRERAARRAAHRGDRLPRVRRRPRPDGAPLLVALDRDLDRSRVGLRSAITTATQAPGVAPLTLGRIAAARRARRRDRGCRSRPGTRGDGIRSVRRRDRRSSRFATILDDTSLHHRTRARRDPAAARRRVAPRSRRPGRPPSPTHRADDGRRRSTRWICCRRAPINLFGSGADLGFWVRNDLPYPVNLDPLRHARRPAPRRAAGDPARRRRVEQHARRGAGAGAGRQRRGDARPAAAQSRERRDRRRRDRRRQRARRVGERRHHRARRSSSAALLVLGVVRTVLRMRGAAHGGASAEGAPPTPKRPRRPKRRAGRPTRSAASERHRARERADRRRDDRLAPERVPARRRPRRRPSARRPRRATRSRSPTSCRTTSTRSSRPAC